MTLDQSYAQLGREVREITSAEMDRYITISANAYPGSDLTTPEARERFRERMTQSVAKGDTHLLALFEDTEMLGVMRWYDFSMNLFGTPALVGGIGGVAVGLPHKKKGVAADMLRSFLRHYRDGGACLAALYPFRPDFYRRMGFGYGTPLQTYRFRPSSLPRAEARTSAVILGAEDQQAVADCYARYQKRTHGLMTRDSFLWENRFNDPSNHFVGLKHGSELSGYLIFRFEKGSADHFLSNNIFIREIVYESAGDLRELLAFLHVQADQIEEIILNTFDSSFFYVLEDPRYGAADLLPHVVYHESSIQGVGLMYRVLDVPRLFSVLADHNFGGQTLDLRITLHDSFFPENAGSTTVAFKAGRAAVRTAGEAQTSMMLDVADFSSLVLGCIGARHLFDLGLLMLSDANYLGQVEQLFSALSPICLTSF